MKAVIYVRVSTKEQVLEGNSLATQERICREFAIKNDYETVRVFVERGESAKTANRTELQEMMKFTANRGNAIDAVIFYKLDRLTRDTGDYAQLSMFFKEINIELVSTSEQYEDTPVGRFMRNVIASQSQFDNEVRAERSKNGMIDGVSEGRWQWKAPVGYVNGWVNGKRNILPANDDHMLYLIRKTFDLVASGVKPELVRRIINDEGFVNDNGNRLSKSAFYKMLENTLYKGVIQAFGLTIISSSIVPIVDPSIYDLAIKRYKGVEDKKVERKYMKANPLFPLRNILNCPNGHHMTASAPRGNGGVYYKYHCSRCRGKGTTHDKDLAESQFVDFLKQFSYEAEVQELLINSIKASWDFRMRNAKQKKKRLEAELEKLESRQRVVISKSIDGVLSDEIVKQALSDISFEKANISLDLNELNVGDDELGSLLEFGLTQLSDIGGLWQSIDDVDVKQRFQKWLFPAGVVYDGNKFETSTLPLSISIKKDLSEEKSLLVTSRRIELRLPG